MADKDPHFKIFSDNRQAGHNYLLLERFETLMPVSDEVKWMDTYFARGPRTLPVEFKVR